MKKIVLPIVIVLLAVAGYFGYQRYGQARRQTVIDNAQSQLQQDWTQYEKAAALRSQSGDQLDAAVKALPATTDIPGSPQHYLASDNDESYLTPDDTDALGKSADSYETCKTWLARQPADAVINAHIDWCVRHHEDMPAAQNETQP